MNNELQHEMSKRIAAEQLVEKLTAELEAVRDESNECQLSLEHNDKMASLGVLTAGIAHEINNPVGYIISNVNTLCEYLPDIQQLIGDLRNVVAAIPDSSPIANQRDAIQATAKDKDIDFLLEDTNSILEETLEGAQRVLSIVRGLRNFARADEDVFELGNIAECLSTTLKLVNNELKYTSKIVTHINDVPDSYINAGRLGQVFLNLMVNAGHAIEDQGVIEIFCQQRDDKIDIRIKDNGCGIDTDLIDRIFEAFFTTKPEGQGTGLGLSISRGIVEEHGGEISVESTPGEGTTFLIVLPMLSSPPQPTETEQPI